MFSSILQASTVQSFLSFKCICKSSHSVTSLTFREAYLHSEQRLIYNNDTGGMSQINTTG